jgi:hypothetical protein
MWGTSPPGYSGRRAMREFFLLAKKVAAELATAIWRRDTNAYPYWQNYWYERIRPDIFRLGVLWGVFNQKGGLIRNGNDGA